MKLEYSRITRSVSWLLMAWLLVLPGHQQPGYWLCRINESLSSMSKCLWYLSVMKSWKIQIHYYVPVSGIFHSQMASDVVCVSMLWYHHEYNVHLVEVISLDTHHEMFAEHYQIVKRNTVMDLAIFTNIYAVCFTKYAHSLVLFEFCFYYQSVLPTFLRVDSLSLDHSYDSLSATEEILLSMSQ